MPIGRFSRITRLSVRMLRHYDELGLLTPALVDPASGYRYYSLAQADEAQRIRLLRSLDMPLEDIRALLLERDPGVVRDRLERHRRQLESQAARLSDVIAALEGLDGRDLTQAYPVRVRVDDAQTALVRRARTDFEAMKRDLGAIYAELYTALARQDARPAGAPFVAFMGEGFDENDLEYTVGVPCEASVIAPERLERLVLPAGPVAFTLHPGAYDGIERAYRALIAWMQEHGHQSSGPPREAYLVGKGQVERAADYRTEIIWPLG